MDKTHLDPLTQRERDILRLLSNGLSDSEIAEQLVLTVGTVKWYNRQIYSKLDVRSRAQAVLQAQRRRLIEKDSGETLTPTQAHNLPAQVTSFIGRRQALAELKKLLKTTRLLTLTGPPGTGKTRLALQLAEEMLEFYRDGVYFVPLAPLRDPDHVASSIAHALNVSIGSLPVVDSLKQHIRQKSLLLILDNFEHLLTAAPLVTDLLSAAPHLTILTTSREILRLYGEHEFQVPPLQVPDLKGKTLADTVKECESVRLFMQRANAVSPMLSLDEFAPSIAAICVHLDGLPLALELAAARTRVYAPQTLLVRLSSRLDALVDGPRDLPARQKTLRDTLAWSYDLLEPDEKTLFSRLGVFVDGCTLESARAVCGDGLAIDAAYGLESLLNKSLLRQEAGTHGDMRFVMLETMREFALDTLEHDAEAADMRQRHAHYFIEMIEQASKEVYTPEQTRWFRWFDAEHDNVRAALRWCLQADNTGELALRMIADAAHFWESRGNWSEGRSWLEAALALERAASRTEARADALHNVGQIIYMLSDYQRTRGLLEEAVSIYRELDDLTKMAHTVITMGEVETEVGNYQAAFELFQQGYEILHRYGDQRSQGRALMQLGWGAMRFGDYGQAQAWLEQSVALYTAIDSTLHVAIATSGLGEVALRQGHLGKATELLERSLALRREIGNRWGSAASLGSLAWVAILQADFERATANLSESIAIRKDIGDRGGLAWCFEKLAEIALLRGDFPRAARTFGAAASQRASINSVVDPADQPHFEQMIAQIQAALGDEIFKALWGEGQAMSLDDVIIYAVPTA